jgi:transcriptional regulator with XRE-family HTH domain
MQAGNSANSRGPAIRQERQRLGLSAKRLAEMAGVDRDTLAAIEKGAVRGKPYRRGPNQSTVEAIERTLARIRGDD